MNNAKLYQDYAWMSQASYLDFSSLKSDSSFKHILQNNTVKEKVFLEDQVKLWG